MQEVIEKKNYYVDAAEDIKSKSKKTYFSSACVKKDFNEVIANIAARLQ